MNEFKKLLAMLLLTPLILSACATKTSSEEMAQNLKIVTTFPPLYSFVSNLVNDDLAKITNLVPPGASVHTWEPSASALRALSDADLLVMNGLGLEPFIEDLIESVQNPNLTIVVTGDTVHDELLAGEEESHEDHHRHGDDDPHTWLSPRLVVKQVEAISDTLIKIDPDNVEIYKANTATYVAKLQALDQEIREKLDAVTMKDFIVFHDAYAYYLTSYGLDIYKKSAIEPFPGKEPTAAYFQELIELIEDQGVSIIFTEPQFNPRVVQNIQEETGASSFEIDPIGLELSREGYEYNISAITDTFIQAFTQ
jgi:zinc transport system substrate-binding protein